MKKLTLIFGGLLIAVVVLFIMKIGTPTNVSETSAAQESNKVEKPTDSNDKDYLDIGYSLMKNESLDFLRENLLDAEVIKNLGEPEEKSEAVVWGADGLEHQTWYYKTKGIKLDMIRDKDNQVVNMITITSPCSYKTKKNIGIGSTLDEVTSAYGDEIEPSYAKENIIVVGSIYGGMIFHFENNHVSLIYIGASAE